METIYQSPLLTIVHHNQTKIFELFFTPSQNDTEEIIKNEFNTFSEMLDKYKPLFTLWDLRNFLANFNEELRLWIDSEINRKEVEAGIIKEAFIMPTDLIARLNINEVMENDYAQKLKFKYFATRDKALEWLLD